MEGTHTVQRILKSTKNSPENRRIVYLSFKVKDSKCTTTWSVAWKAETGETGLA